MSRGLCFLGFSLLVIRPVGPGEAGEGSRHSSGAVTLLEFLVAAAGARVVAAYILQGVAHGLLRLMVAVWAVYMAVVMCVMIMVVVMVAIRAMHVRLLRHFYYSESKPAGVISPVRRRERLWPNNTPVRSSPSSRYCSGRTGWRSNFASGLRCSHRLVRTSTT